MALPTPVDKVLEWATRYTFRLVGEINQATRDGLAEAIEEFAVTPPDVEPWTMGDLRERVATIFSPDRAQRIAVTETTRAYAEGGRIAADEVRASGLEIKDIFETENDGLVCEICGPLDGQDITQDPHLAPPLHPNCRCRVRHEVA